MSAHIAYHASPEMSESDYTVVSNINRHGIPPVEAAAHIADLAFGLFLIMKNKVVYVMLEKEIPGAFFIS